MSNASFYNCPCGERRTFANPATLGRWRRLHNKFCDAVGNDQQTEKEFVQGLKKSAKKAAKQARQNTTRGGRNWRDGVNRAPNGDLIMTDQVDIVAINTETGRNEIVQRIERPMNAPRSQDFSAATVMNSPSTPDLADYTEETLAATDFATLRYKAALAALDAEEEEDIEICGETGGLFKGFKGCGAKFDCEGLNKLGNTSFCQECYDKHIDRFSYPHLFDNWHLQK
tara:strand:- start:466 stop:1146 length:681 start_codon:yes stop_codon:yes gene_type:complete